MPTYELPLLAPAASTSAALYELAALLRDQGMA